MSKYANKEAALAILSEAKTAITIAEMMENLGVCRTAASNACKGVIRIKLTVDGTKTVHLFHPDNKQMAEKFEADFIAANKDNLAFRIIEMLSKKPQGMKRADLFAECKTTGIKFTKALRTARKKGVFSHDRSYRGGARLSGFYAFCLVNCIYIE